MFYWENAEQSDLNLLRLIKFVFNNKIKLLEFIFHPTVPKLNAQSEELLKMAGCFSSGEYILIQVALDIWDNSGNTLLVDIVSILDANSCQKVFKAMQLKGMELLPSTL